MLTVTCPVCRTHCRLPLDVRPQEQFACPDCGESSAAPEVVAVPSGKNLREWLPTEAPGAAPPKPRTLGRVDPLLPTPRARGTDDFVFRDPPGLGDNSSAFTLLAVALLGLVIGLAGYLALDRGFMPQQQVVVEAPPPPPPTAPTRKSVRKPPPKTPPPPAQAAERVMVAPAPRAADNP